MIDLIAKTFNYFQDDMLFYNIPHDVGSISLRDGDDIDMYTERNFGSMYLIMTNHTTSEMCVLASVDDDRFCGRHKITKDDIEYIRTIIEMKSI